MAKIAPNNCFDCRKWFSIGIYFDWESVCTVHALNKFNWKDRRKRCVAKCWINGARFFGGGANNVAENCYIEACGCEHIMFGNCKIYVLHKPQTMAWEIQVTYCFLSKLIIHPYHIFSFNFLHDFIHTFSHTQCTLASVLAQNEQKYRRRKGGKHKHNQ